MPLSPLGGRFAGRFERLALGRLSDVCFVVRLTGLSDGHGGTRTEATMDGPWPCLIEEATGSDAEVVAARLGVDKAYTLHVPLDCTLRAKWRVRLLDREYEAVESSGQHSESPLARWTVKLVREDAT